MKRTLLVFLAATAMLTAYGQQKPTKTAAKPVKAAAKAAKPQASCDDAAEEAAMAKAPAARKTGAGKTYGAAVTEAGARPMSALPLLLGKRDSVKVKLIGEASDVCQAKGCWMTLKTADGKQMRVRFKDYAFFVPKDTKGKTVVVDGWAHREQISVADQQHYLKDAGKSDKEIAAVTRPQEQLTFMADGVLIKN